MLNVSVFLIATWQTLYMVVVASLIAASLGIPLGLLLYAMQKNELWPHLHSYRILSACVNALRSIPFIILLIAILPFTRLIIGTSIGTTAAIVPLCVSAIPFIARLVETALKEVSQGLIEMGQSLGASTWQILSKIVFKEALPSIIQGITLTVIALVGFSAMAGTVGGGGLGDLAIREGYQRFDWQVMLATVIILIVLVQLIQSAGNYLARWSNKRLYPVHKPHLWRNTFISLFIFVMLCCLPALPWSTTDTTIKLGCMSGPEETLMKTVQSVAEKKYGLKLKLITFNDYTLPNEALNNGDIDANYFQHIPYLQTQIAARHYDITAIGRGFIYPMGLYSTRYQHLSQLPEGATIGIPNDPSNEARALLLLQSAGLVGLTPGKTTEAVLADIRANPQHLRLIELDAAQLSRSLKDLDAAAITNTYASAAGLLLKNALIKENQNSLYGNVLVVRSQDQHNPQLKKLLAALQSEEVEKAANTLFNGSAIACWKDSTEKNRHGSSSESQQ